MNRYYYAPLRRRYAVYKRTSEFSAEKVEDYATKEEARKRVYELNNWAEK